MKSLPFILAVFMAGPVLRADPAPATVPPPAPAATTPVAAADPITEALPILQANYIGFKDLNYKPGDRLEDLVARSKGGISVVAPDPAASSQPILAVNLPSGILYWRLATFAPVKGWADLVAQLQAPALLGIVLDLRGNLAPDDYAGAATVLGFFAPGDTTLAKFNSAAATSGKALAGAFHAPVVVLIDGETSGAGEVLAACLKNDGALVIGQATRGAAAVFSQAKLSSGQMLRYATAPISLADGTPLWGHPVTPDIGLNVDERSEKSALVMIKDNHIDDVIQESAERHRMSEASLVQGQDPELDDYLATLEKKAQTHFLLSLPPIHDIVLTSAIDSLKAIRISQRPTPFQSDAGAAPQPPVSVQ